MKLKLYIHRCRSLSHTTSKGKIFEKYKLGTMIPTLIPSVKELLNQKSALCHLILQPIKISLRYNISQTSVHSLT
ncbi:hypothetical protein HanRHA438_Chr15g0723151 [Helianthus annuus]|nr:hypothetical protein HanIR_Chr15g0773611 [Helianthus annuus]KAJ0846284.1 hypothetical protein HanRHA438_Chr15g0723151 [Helianthus annuus]